MGIFTKIYEFLKKNIKVILLAIQIAKELEKRIDPNEKYVIDDKVIDVIEKLAKKIEGK